MAEMTRLRYLMGISREYGLETREFLKRFPEAWADGEASYGGISIRCRQKADGYGIFSVMRDRKVIAQVGLYEATLKRLPEADLASFPLDEIAPFRRRERPGSAEMKIKDLNAGVKWVDLRARVVDKSGRRAISSRSGDRLDSSTATISDGTGSVKLLLWNSQIDIASVGSMVRIEHGRLRNFRGELQVSVGRNGKLEVIEDR